MSRLSSDAAVASKLTGYWQTVIGLGRAGPTNERAGLRALQITLINGPGRAGS